MSRIEAQAVGGYYKTPEKQLPRIAGLLRLASPEDPDKAREVAVLDPCAGDGEAICEIARRIYPPWTPSEEEAPRPPGEYLKHVNRFSYSGTCDAMDHHAEEGCSNPACEKFVADAIREPARRARLRQRYEKSVAEHRWVRFYTCELEASRYKALRDQFSHPNAPRALHGDAFCASFDIEDGVGLLYLNPPYDQDKVCGRLEERFLRRFATTIHPGGVLAFVVPHHALSASAETIGRMFEKVTCWRFADGGFDAFKQVVLFGRRREVDLGAPDLEVAARVRAWAGDPPASELPAPGDPIVGGAYEIPLADGDALSSWRIQPIDAAALTAKFAPWHASQRGGRLAPIASILPDLPIGELMHRTYDVAVPPRPAHIAAGLAAGIFNGARIDPDDPVADLPPLLVKGVFDREWRTIEEKHDKWGEKTAEVQVQVPKLVVTILDLAARAYHTLPTGAEKTGAREVSQMAVADLLDHYGRALMRVMERQCRILYDPRRSEDAGREIAPAGRQPFAAHEHAVRACVKVIQEQAKSVPLLLGEIGSGKSACALLVGMTIGARRLLVVCPPHLLDSWRNEVRATLPEAEFRALQTVSDVDDLAREGTGIRGMAAYLADCRARWLRGDPVLADREYDQLKADLARARAGQAPIVAALSREAAKLGHGYAAVAGACPRCGAALHEGVDFARKRSRCEHRTRRPADAYAALAHRLALCLRPSAETPTVHAILDGRVDEILRERRRDADPAERAKSYRGIPVGLAHAILYQLAWDGASARAKDSRPSGNLWRAVAWLFAAAPDAAAAEKLVPILHESNHLEQHAVALAAAFLPADRARAVVAALPETKDSYYGAPLDTLGKKLQALVGKERVDETADGPGIDVGGVRAWCVKGGLRFGPDGDIESGSLAAALHLLDALRALASWRFDAPCGELLYQAAPEPRRFALARYIAKRHQNLFDFLVLDECHELSVSMESAQSIAAHRLYNTIRVPTVFMTGSIMSGYASSLFANMTSASPGFREEFDRGEENGFIKRYGYRKRVVSDREDGEVVAFGAQSDRIERVERDAGEAPGILPLFLFRHLLPCAVTLHKADLRVDLQPLTQDRSIVEADGELREQYDQLLRKVLRQIKEDRFKPDVAGRLFGALAELGSYLDRATVDTWAGEGLVEYEVRYPEAVPKVGGKLVASARLFPAKTVLPKEAAMLDFVESEVHAGRNVMVFGWHLNLLLRLQRLVEERLGEPAPILWADKVPTPKRQAWIDEKIVRRGVRVMVLNPVCVSTGLNNLVHFASEWHHENPACNAIVDRQAIGRIDRIGQKLPPKVVRAYYGKTLQEKMYNLLMAKIAISTATDGLDATSALAAAGLDDSATLTGLSIGKQLWRMYEEEVEEAKVVPIAAARARRK